MTRDEIIGLVREHYDPEPRDWPRHRGWDDGAGDIADRLLRRMIPNPVMAMAECPQCGIKAETLEHRFCTREPCPVNRPGAPENEIAWLKSECFALAANQCHAGYGDDYGNHRCEKIDTLKDALLGLIEAVELDSDNGGKGISGYTAARLTDARAALGASSASRPER